ncbi:MAG: hypothetical protein KDB27_11920, partial [Planctomycetales bacterium]|nr:hypothetical protein [Planctomycetales bacterium]
QFRARERLLHQMGNTASDRTSDHNLVPDRIEAKQFAGLYNSVCTNQDFTRAAACRHVEDL